ncbi:MAG: nitronate monooxygenase [Gammaproteobacteria bacterium]|nr:nitronate monooxygenase [Gammaproteobacteria bacterium]
MAGGITTPELIAAVSNAGGLGSLGAGYLSADEITDQIKKIRALTDKPFAVNLFIPDETSIVSSEQVDAAKQLLQPYYETLGISDWGDLRHAQVDFESQMQAVIDARVPVFSFTFGVLKEKYITALKQQGVFIIGTATAVNEAIMLASSGVDAVVAQGEEAGGHRATFHGEVEDSLVAMDQLVAECVEEIELPVIAAGGIMNAEQIKQALDQGATAVQMGTAFLTCDEANIATCYKKSLLEGQADNTVLTRAFSGRYGRAIANRLSGDLEQFRWLLPPYPIQHALTKQLRQVSSQNEEADFMSLWAGRHYHQCRSQSVETLMSVLTDQLCLCPI